MSEQAPQSHENDLTHLKPEVVWTPDLNVTAENWEDLKEQGWNFAENLENATGPINLGQSSRGGARRGIGNFITGAVFDEAQGRPLTDEEARAQREPGIQPRGTYWRISLMDLADKASLATYDQCRETGVWEIEGPNIISRTGVSPLSGNNVTNTFDTSAIANPYERRRLTNAVEDGIFDGWQISLTEETVRRTDEWTYKQAELAIAQREQG